MLFPDFPGVEELPAHMEPWTVLKFDRDRGRGPVSGCRAGKLPRALPHGLPVTAVAKWCRVGVDRTGRAERGHLAAGGPWVGAGAVCPLCLENLGKEQTEVLENWWQPGCPCAKEARGEKEAESRVSRGESHDEGKLLAWPACSVVRDQPAHQQVSYSSDAENILRCG